MKSLITLLLILTGCASIPKEGYNCFKVEGPYYARLDNSKDAEEHTAYLDWERHHELFNSYPFHYECVQHEGPSGRIDGK